MEQRKLLKNVLLRNRYNSLYDKWRILMAEFVLDFERPVVELEKRIAEMKAYTVDENVELTDEIRRLEVRLNKLMVDTYSKLTRWQRYQLAKHPDRP